MAEAEPQDGRRFSVSSAEIRRREAAFDRLGVAAVASVALTTGDLALRGVPAAIVIPLLLALAFLAARVGLGRTFRRFSETVWTVSPGTLRRTDPRSDSTYQLRTLKSLGAKRTTSGAVRELRLGFDGGTTVYVNALDEGDAFRALLVGSCPAPIEISELREAIDFDAPWFYAVLGTGLGAVLGSVVRLASTASGVNMRLVWGAGAAYSLALGAYWLRAKPLSGRFGEKSAVADRVAGGLMLLLGLAGIVAVFLARPV